MAATPERNGMRLKATNKNSETREIPSPPAGERARVRGRGAIDSSALEHSTLSPSSVLRTPSPPAGEKEGMRGRAPQYGKHRTRTAAARDFARQLRSKSTDAEKRLWRLLRDRHFNEFKFRRQYACGIYFLDFYCTLAKLAVELDGGGHGFPDQRATKNETSSSPSKESKCCAFGITSCVVNSKLFTSKSGTR